MAAAFRSTSGVAYGGRSNTTVPAPAGIQDGDILLLFVGLAGGSPPTPTFPAGFTEVDGPISNTLFVFTVNYYCLWKRASGESGDYTITHDGATTFAQMYCISGAKASGSPINASSTNNGIGSTSTATGITTTVDGCLIVFGEHDWGDTGNNLSPPAGSTPTFTERADTTLRYYADGVLATAGATGDKSITSNSSPSSPWGAYLVAIEPLVELTAHELTAANLAIAAPTVGTPALTQRHALTPTSLATAAPTVGAPALTQKHALSASNVAIGAPTCGAPALSQRHSLVAANLAIGAPVAGPAAFIVDNGADIVALQGERRAVANFNASHARVLPISAAQRRVVPLAGRT